jgi:bud site selection protein 20
MLQDSPTIFPTNTPNRDLDLIKSDLKSTKHLTQHKEATAAEDLPALGEHYCVECAKWFESNYNIAAHRRGKNHKRRVRMLKEEAHSQKAADAAVGLGVDNGRLGQMERMDVEESTDVVT